MSYGQKTFLNLPMVKFRLGGRKTARRAAKRPPTGKPKLSRVTSGYGDWGTYDPIELGPSEPKKWGCIGVAYKNADFRAIFNKSVSDMAHI